MTVPKLTRSHVGDLQQMPGDCQNNTDDKDKDDNNDEQEALFLREKIVEVAREGDTSEMEYLLGVSIARKLLTAVDKVNKHRSSTRAVYCSMGWLLSRSVLNFLAATIANCLLSRARSYGTVRVLQRAHT